ncbi:MAG: sugar transferase [Pseudomonadota bacterium]
MVNLPISDGKIEEGWLSRVKGSFARILSSISFQLLSVLIVGVLAPALLRYNFERVADKFASYDNSFIGTVIAILLGYFTFRKVAAFPRNRELMRVLPTFMISYGLVLAVFLMWRLEYSRYQFASSFVMSTVWLSLIVLALPRLKRMTIALVETAKSKSMKRISSIDWIPLSDPRSIPENQAIPIAADFSDPSLSAEWSSTLAREVLEGRSVLNAKLVQESITGKVQVRHLSDNPLGQLSPDNLYAVIKRYLDVVFALAALVFLFPVMAVIAVAVMIDSPGGAFYHQRRVGYLGQSFTLFKFRSMRAEEPGNGSSDPTKRITRVGRFIRKTRLDELPQILNILLGHMSWIGPRPEVASLSARYADVIPFYAYRHIVRPGISGWAQVQQGHVTSLTDVTEKLEYDFYYIKHFSIWIDILIAARTIKVMMTGFGAK